MSIPRIGWAVVLVVGPVVCWGGVKSSPGAERPREVTNSIGMKFVLIPAGEFMMGSSESPEELAKAFAQWDTKPKHFKDEHPRHRVKIAKPFYLGKHEVTVGQFRQFVNDSGDKADAKKGDKKSYGFNSEPDKFWFDPDFSWPNVGFPQTDEHPVVNVSWNDAVAFCKWLSRKEGKEYRLPTEAQWEYACRAGTTTRYYNGDDPEGLVRVGNVADATAKRKLSKNVADATAKGEFSKWKGVSSSDGYVFTAPVGRFRPNGFGLYDMHGNVFEWCADWYGEGYYDASPATDPKGPNSGKYHVLRGGDWSFEPRFARSAARTGTTLDFRFINLGFRVARTP